MSDELTLIEGIRSLESRIREAADQIEKNYWIPRDLTESFREIGLFRATWPKALGGAEMDYIELLEALEELSRYDGSVGWVGTFAAISGLTASHLAPDAIAQLFKSADSGTAGQYAPVGKAERVEGGFRVSGRWSFGSGCLHADVMMAGVVVTENGHPARDTDGRVQTRIVLFPIEKAELFPESWRTTGMRGTGSLDYAVRDLFVPEQQSFDYFAAPLYEGPLYASPMLFLGSHVPMPLGIARAAIDYVVELSHSKRYPPGPRLLRDDDYAQVQVAEAEAMLGSVRAWTYEVMRDFWGTLCRKEPPSARQRAMFRLSLVHVSRVAKEVVEKMYDVAASSAIKQNSPMDRLMRDILTICQHRVVSPRMYRPAGKALLGVPIENDPFF